TAFNTLVEQFQSAAFTVALRILGDRDGAADAVQDAFISAFRAIGRFRGGSFRVWLLRIVHNVCLDYLRARARRPTVSLDTTTSATDDTFTELSHDTIAALIDPAWDPSLIMERKALQDLLQQALLSLPEDQRVAVVLCDIEGMAYEEIAEITSAQTGTV